MIGLNKNAVQIVEHDEQWAPLAQAACRDVAFACGNLLVDVQHVGSTAVPGLTAKPILDLAAGIGTQDVVAHLILRLSDVGYLYRGDSAELGGHLFVKESAPDVRTIHLHVVQHGGVQWINYLAFRDLLRASPDVRAKYTELKQQLAKAFSQDRPAYTQSKHAFISEVLQAIRAHK